MEEEELGKALSPKKLQKITRFSISLDWLLYTASLRFSGDVLCYNALERRTTMEKVWQKLIR